MSQKMRLGEFAEINPRVQLTRGRKYPHVSMADVTPGRRYAIAGGVKAYSGGGARFHTGDTLFARITPCLENGKIAQFIGKHGDVGFGSTEFVVFRARPGVSDPGYLFYLASTDEVRKPAEKSMTGASGRQRVDVNNLINLQIYAPPLPAQRKIAAILSAYDDLIENNLRRIKILEEMAQLIYREWFVHYRFPGYEDVPMVDSPLGPIPEGWEVVRLGDSVEILRDSISPADFESEIFEHFSFEAFDSGALPVLERGVALRSTKYIVHNGCVLLAKLNPRIPRVWLPFTDAELRSVTSTEFLVLMPRPPVSKHLLFCTCASEDFLRRFAGLALGTSTSHQRVKPADLLSMSVVRPPAELGQEFDDALEPILTLTAMLRQTNAKLRTSRDLLLAPLVSGDIDVSELQTKVGELVQ